MIVFNLHISFSAHTFLKVELLPYRGWYIGSVKKRFRFPFWWEWFCAIPQPRWLKRWYYCKSFDWWGHPSNHHWKGWCFVDKQNLRSGERDLWGGAYVSPHDLTTREDEN